ncbi:uncharacterized protein LOC120713382 [Panicum virgatum]|uniref:uncharacterized protein LOC120713382 n=1 Tax=Panicum virgatum TaxID=38727 RepID=UPI0019D68415|nr:uncharacterized protein LOC120713382 [Panicum virgatum]
MGSFNKLLNMVTGLKKRYDIGNQLKEIKQRALEVSDRRKRYKMDTSSAKSVVIDPRLPGLFQEAEKLVGINTQRDKIVKLLTSGTNLYQQKVLSIVGSGGLGKTTLAKQPLDANDLQDLFLSRIFKDEVDFPQELKQVTTDILRKCDGLPLAIVSIASMLATKPASRQEWERFKILRVLDIEGCSSAQNSGYPESICTLVHLRYLRLVDSSIKRLEGDIGRMKSLKTLDLSLTLIEQLPAGVTKLKQLVHLFVPFTVTLPKGIGKMEALEELSVLNAIKTSPEALEELEKLEKLKFEDVWHLSGSEEL